MNESTTSNTTPRNIIPHNTAAGGIAKDQSTMDLCLICNKADARLCSQCHSSFYCSKKCQTADYPIHKLLCSDFKAFNTTSRPSDEHFRAVVFPVNERKPKLVWLHCKSDTEGYQSPNIKTLLGPNAPLAQKPIRYNPVLKRYLSNTIFLNFRDTALIDGSTPNESVRSLLNTKAGRYFDWCGQLGAYTAVGLYSDPERCKDLTMDDFRHTTDYLMSLDHYGNPPTTPSGLLTDSDAAAIVPEPSVVDRPHGGNARYPSKSFILGIVLVLLFVFFAFPAFVDYFLSTVVIFVFGATFAFIIVLVTYCITDITVFISFVDDILYLSANIAMDVFYSILLFSF